MTSAHVVSHIPVSSESVAEFGSHAIFHFAQDGLGPLMDLAVVAVDGKSSSKSPLALFASQRIVELVQVDILVADRLESVPARIRVVDLMVVEDGLESIIGRVQVDIVVLGVNRLNWRMVETLREGCPNHLPLEGSRGFLWELPIACSCWVEPFEGSVVSGFGAIAIIHHRVRYCSRRES